MTTTTYPVPVRMLTSDEMAEALQISVRTLRRWVAAGVVPARRIPGGELRFHPGDIAEVGVPANERPAAGETFARRVQPQEMAA